MTFGQLRWRWGADPFGTAVPVTNPAGLGVFVQNLRFHGQVAYSERGLFYNRLRNYDLINIVSGNRACVVQGNGIQELMYEYKLG